MPGQTAPRELPKFSQDCLFFRSYRQYRSKVRQYTVTCKNVKSVNGFADIFAKLYTAKIFKTYYEHKKKVLVVIS